MKQDYLWDKTGDDAEIKGLEEALSVFRYQETAAPTVRVVEPIPLVRAETRWKFLFGFAFAGSAVMAVILIGILLQFSNVQQPPAPAIATTSEPQPAPQNVDPQRSGDTSDIGVHNIDNTDVTAVPTKAVFRRRIKKRAVGDMAAMKASTRKARPVKFTNEEKYAYGQLMLALSITGSKLKMVRDTINGED